LHNFSQHNIADSSLYLSLYHSVIDEVGESSNPRRRINGGGETNPTSLTRSGKTDCSLFSHIANTADPSLVIHGSDFRCLYECIFN